jgi:hypothetical protein
MLMKAMTVRAVNEKQPRNITLILAMILALVLLIGFFAYRAQQKPEANVIRPETVNISQSVLEEKYGLGVNLVAVTAMGGMVDLRLKIIDGEKAKALLNDPANFPALQLRNGVVLKTSDEIASQAIKFENGGSIYALYPNSRNVVKPGAPVSILFGDLLVEPIPSQ